MIDDNILRIITADVPEESLIQLTDAGSAEFFAALVKDILRYDHQRKRWLIWKGHWWAEDTDGEVIRLAIEVTRSKYRAAERIPDLMLRARIADFAVRSESRQKLDSCLFLARNVKPLADPGNEWDMNPMLLGVANGVVDLETGELRNGRQEDRITQHIDIEFNPEARCPRWNQFLAEVFCDDEALLRYVKRAVGYSLTGLTKEQVFFFLCGLGSNGKTVFLETLLKIFGDYGYITSFETFMTAKGGNGRGHSNELAELAGKRFVVANEADTRGRLSEARLKSLAGGDTRTASYKYGREFSWKAREKIWLAANHKPRVNDSSDGFWRKVQFVPFERQFKGDEADLTLPETLSREAQGILRWAIEGCLEWQDDGLNPPEKVRAAVQEYREESDPLADFISDELTLDPEGEIPAGKAYETYEGWAERNKLKERERLGSRTFGLKMKERFTFKRLKSKRLYRGVRIKGDGDRKMDEPNMEKREEIPF